MRQTHAVVSTQRLERRISIEKPGKDPGHQDLESCYATHLKPHHIIYAASTVVPNTIR
jgi:hypothetical protein